MASAFRLKWCLSIEVRREFRKKSGEMGHLGLRWGLKIPRVLIKLWLHPPHGEEPEASLVGRQWLSGHCRTSFNASHRWAAVLLKRPELHTQILGTFPGWDGAEAAPAAKTSAATRQLVCCDCCLSHWSQHSHWLCSSHLSQNPAVAPCVILGTSSLGRAQEPRNSRSHSLPWAVVTMTKTNSLSFWIPNGGFHGKINSADSN